MPIPSVWMRSVLHREWLVSWPYTDKCIIKSSLTARDEAFQHI